MGTGIFSHFQAPRAAGIAFYPANMNARPCNQTFSRLPSFLSLLPSPVCRVPVTGVECAALCQSGPFGRHLQVDRPGQYCVRAGHSRGDVSCWRVASDHRAVPFAVTGHRQLLPSLRPQTLANNNRQSDSLVLAGFGRIFSTGPVA